MAAGSLSSSTVHTQSNGEVADGQTTADNNVQTSTSSSVSSSDIADVKTALSTNWLGNAERDVIEQYYGIKGQGDTNVSDISSDGATTSAWHLLPYTTLRWHHTNRREAIDDIDLDQIVLFLLAGANSDGGTGGNPMRNMHRIIAHEMVHATNSATTYNMPYWFKEGTVNLFMVQIID